jgi:Zn-dependent protease
LLFGNFTPELILANIIAALLGMTIHEFAHCYVADRMGDPTARRLGRLTLNPFVHIHWLGFLMFVVAGFGILGTAPVNPHLMRNPRWGTLAAVAAGPVSNLLLAIVFAIIYRLLPPSVLFNVGIIQIVLFQIIIMNVFLFLFNLIPLSPLDGYKIVLSLLPPDLAYWWQRHEQTTQYIFFGLILLSFVPIAGISILGQLIVPPARFLLGILIG